MNANRSPLRWLRPLPDGTCLCRRWWWLVLLACLVGVGCNSIQVRRADRPALFDAWRASALGDTELSPRTLQTLRQYDLETVYQRSPAEASRQLHVRVLRHPNPDIVFALAEINYHQGRQAEQQHGTHAIGHYYLCAGYAYHYLFDPPPPGHTTPSSFDPRTRLACDLYNSALAKCIAAAQRIGQLDPRSQLHIPVGDGRDYTLSVAHIGFSWKPEEFGSLLFSSDYQVTGLPNQHRTYGLGVPLIANRAPTAPVPAQAYYPASVSFPATAFFRFEGTLADLGELRAGRLELYNPLSVQSVAVNGTNVPLETDLTTPLAYFLSRARLDTTGYKAFLFPDSVTTRTGLHTLEPYQPGKIPVVFVHGLFSSPLTWAPVYNDLLADPMLRKRFQFWSFFYPTGEPYLVAAADLRRDLERLRKDLDPQRKDPALDEMVFVGHSMGGLVSRLVTVEGGDDFWGLVSQAPLRQLRLEPDTRSELQAVFYFEPTTSIRRVIFLGTPHRGSQVSPSVVGRVGARLAGLPRTLMVEIQDATAENPGIQSAIHHALPNSVDQLDPKSPALELLAARPRPRGVHYHSVIGIIPSTPLLERYLGGIGSERGDGVVPYSSAHLDGVDSELIVPAGHQEVHHHPLAILEVKRVLREHLREVDGRWTPQPGAGIVPVQGKQ
jgi:pimeloyl-ACP methyl ester carboxylesterase